MLDSGGRLVLADFLYSRTGEALSLNRIRSNYLSGLTAYERLLRREGFKDVQVVDVTDACARAYLVRLKEDFIRRFREGEVPEGDFNAVMAVVSEHAMFLTHYVLVGASKL